MLGLACPNGPSSREPGGFLTHGQHGARWGIPAAPEQARAPRRAQPSPPLQGCPEHALLLSEAAVLDLTAKMLHDVTRVTLDVPERRLAGKPLPQTLICRVKVSIWKRGFFFSLHESLSQRTERWPGGPYLRAPCT